MLQVDNVTAGYGALTVLSDVSLSLPAGARLGVFGHNGAGKTTLLRCIVGAVRPSSGTISVEGADTGTASVAENVRRGIGFVPQGRNVFPNLTVEQNLRIAGLLFDPSFVTQVYELFPVLAERRRQRAGSMSGGEQQMLALGRGLMLKPRLLMLDEPSLGLAPVVTDAAFAKIKEIHAMGTAILLVEQNVSRALALVQRAYVLESGRVIMHGTSAELANNKQVQAAYLGI